MKNSKVLKGLSVKMHNRRITLCKAKKDDFINENKPDTMLYGFRILTKRLPESNEKKRVHIEKMDLTDEAMRALVAMWCRIEGIEIKGLINEKEINI